jgi:hypothetical protein
MFPGTPHSVFPMEPVARNGLSLARNGCPLSEASIPGSKVLACYFVTPPACLHARSAVGSPASTGLPRWRQARRLSPLRLDLLACPAASSVSTPLWDFCLPRDQSVQQIPPPGGSPSEIARFPLAPRCLSITRLTADHRSWIATFFGGLLFLKPLGTFLTMIPNCLSVKDFVIEDTRFPQYLSVLFITGYSDFTLNSLWIKRPLEVVYFSPQLPEPR